MEWAIPDGGLVRSDAPHHQFDCAGVFLVWVVRRQDLVDCFAAVRLQMREAVTDYVDSGFERIEACPARIPAEHIIVVRVLAACGFHERKTRKQAPVQMIDIGGFQKYMGKAFGWAFRLVKEFSQSS